MGQDVRALQAIPTDQISPDDASYLSRVREQAQYAQQLDQEAVQLEQQANEKRQQANRLYGAHESWIAHLCLKYGLDPKADQIDHDTRQITRAPRLDLVAVPPTVNGID